MRKTGYRVYKTCVCSFYKTKFIPKFEKAYFKNDCILKWLVVVQLFSQVQLFVYDAMDCSMLGFPVLHYLLQFAQTQVHWVGDAIQPSRPLLSPSED